MKEKSSKNKKKKSLKSLKEEINTFIEKDDFNEIIEKSLEIINYYPKNIYGYSIYLKTVTKSYTSYLDDDKFKEAVKIYDLAMKNINKKEQLKLRDEFEEYQNDIKEVENLKKIKKEIISKYFLKNLYNNGISFINQSISTAKQYNADGKRIKNIYDFVRGLFFIFCLVFNLINRNYLLFITVPFGIYGFITIYSFFDMNFFKKGTFKTQQRKFNEILLQANEKINELKKEIVKIEENLNFLYEQKLNIILRIPESFFNSIKESVEQNEEAIANDISHKLSTNKINEFEEILKIQTILDGEEIKNKIKSDIKNEETELSKFITQKLDEKKHKQNEALFMKKVSFYNYIVLIILLFLSVFSLLIVVDNFYELNFVSFVASLVTAITSTITYNIFSGKHSSLGETFYDNLISTIFNATLIYDLFYLSITNELKFTYGFMQIPIIMTLIMIGFTMLISMLKYNNLFKRLRG